MDDLVYFKDAIILNDFVYNCLFICKKIIGSSSGGVLKEPHFVKFIGKQTEPIQSPLKYAEELSGRS